MPNNRPKVYLVGAGPGDPGLLTLHAVRALKSADVIIYDRLIGESILNSFAPEAAERIYAGKLPDKHTLTQEEINTLIVQKALEGKQVVRLKGGDPFVFGRGAEEAEACSKAGIPYEVIPGITSAIAAPAYAGIPVTHRQLSSSFAVVTGHESPDKTKSSVDYAALAKSVDTIVILMGMVSLEAIVSQALKGEVEGDTPAAVIQWGTTPQQKIVVATLDTICDEVSKFGVSSPAVIVIGETVKNYHSLQWLKNRPLFGKTIVVTRARETASDFAFMLEMLGAETIQFPAIRIEQLQPQPGDHEVLKRISSFDWIVCSSPQSVKGLINWLLLAGMDARALANCKLAAIGSATASEMTNYALKCDFIPSRFVSETFVNEFLPLAQGKSILLIQPLENRQVIADSLAKLAAVHTIHPYRTVTEGDESHQLLDQLSGNKIDFITFTSSSTVTGFVQQIGFDKVGNSVKLVSIGPATTATLKEAGVTPHLQADPHTIQGMLDAISAAVSEDTPLPSQDH